MGDQAGKLVKVMLRRMGAGIGAAAAIALAILSILGAFLKADGAKRLFASWPMAALWLLLALFLIAALVLGKLRRGGGAIALAHLGGLLVLIGGIAGSDAAHALADAILGIHKAPGGYMVLGQGEQSNLLLAADLRKPLAELPFSLRLRKFGIERYPLRDQPWELAVNSAEPAGTPAETALEPIPWEIGRETQLPCGEVRLKVLEYVPHARLVPPATVKADANSPVPAMRVELGSGQVRRQVWLTPTEKEPRAGVSATAVLGLSGEIGLHLLPPPQQVKDYASEVEVLGAARVVGGGTIRVNQPLHYGGYHFYQYACDEEGGQFTILSAVSDWGLIPAAAGGALLVAGTFGACWVYPAWMLVCGRRSLGGQT